MHRSGCPISIALELLGDAWSLLVIRDLMFKGRHTFNEFLAGGEGIATNILADRLHRLDEAGIIEKHPDPADRRRSLYRLTRRGHRSGVRAGGIGRVVGIARITDAPPEVVREMRENRRAFLAGVRRQWEAQAGTGA